MMIVITKVVKAGDDYLGFSVVVDLNKRKSSAKDKVKRPSKTNRKRKNEIPATTMHNIQEVPQSDPNNNEKASDTETKSATYAKQ